MVSLQKCGSITWVCNYKTVYSKVQKIRKLCCNPYINPSNHCGFLSTTFVYVPPAECIFVISLFLRTVIISLFRINGFAFITETACVRQAARTGYLNKI